MNISEIEEGAINSRLFFALCKLLSESFPDEPCFTERIYYKQLPQRRLILEEDDIIAGQLGLEHRVIGTESGPASILGVIDLCVLNTLRGRGLASKLLQHVEQQAREQNIDFLMLFAFDSRMYERAGFSNRSNTLKWLAVHEHQSLGVRQEAVDELMIKEVGDKPWPAGTVDLLGYLF